MFKRDINLMVFFSADTFNAALKIHAEYRTQKHVCDIIGPYYLFMLFIISYQKIYISISLRLNPNYNITKRRVNFAFRLYQERLQCPSIKPAPGVFIQHLTRGCTSARHDRSYCGIHLRSSANKRGGFRFRKSLSALKASFIILTYCMWDQTGPRDAFSVWGFLALPSATAMISHELCVI